MDKNNLAGRPFEKFHILSFFYSFLGHESKIHGRVFRIRVNVYCTNLLECDIMQISQEVSISINNLKVKSSYQESLAK